VSPSEQRMRTGQGKSEWQIGGGTGQSNLSIRIEGDREGWSLGDQGSEATAGVQAVFEYGPCVSVAMAIGKSRWRNVGRVSGKGQGAGYRW
jgi:hypothetical protein